MNKNNILNIINLVAFILFIASAIFTWAYKIIPLNQYLAGIAIVLAIIANILNVVFQ